MVPGSYFFYEGMQTALREATIDENDVVQFIEIWRTVFNGNGNSGVKSILNISANLLPRPPFSRPFILLFIAFWLESYF